jgi:hypothetical protein
MYSITRSRTGDRAERGDSRRTPGRRRATGPYRGRHTATGELSARVQRVERAVQDARVQQLFSSKSSTIEQHTRCKHCHGAIALKQQDV